MIVQSGLIVENRLRNVLAPAPLVHQCFSGIGDTRGWYFATFLWQFRGLVDRLLGGVGLRMGRRHPDDTRTGDALDVSSVEAVEPNIMIRLRAEMKLPGKAWLQFKCTPDIAGTKCNFCT